MAATIALKKKVHSNNDTYKSTSAQDYDYEPAHALQDYGRSPESVTAIYYFYCTDCKGVAEAESEKTCEIGPGEVESEKTCEIGPGEVESEKCEIR